MTNFLKNTLAASVIALLILPTQAQSADEKNTQPQSVTKPKMSTEPLIDLGAELEVMPPSINPPNTEPAIQAAPPNSYTPDRAPQVQPRVLAPRPVPSQPTAAQAAAHQTELSAVEWSYSGAEGPRNWGDLSPGFDLCKSGKNQSPIDLKESKAVGTTGLLGFDVYYRDVALKIMNTGHTVQVNIPLGSYIKMGGQRFELLHYEFHTPSEHQKNGFNYPMEVQLIHKDGDGNIVVIAVIFQEGRENEYLSEMLMHLPREIGKENIVNIATVSPAKLFPVNKNFYKYNGSLTTPPCDEGVYWMVFKEPVEASAEQIQQLNELMGENARPIQPNHARTLLKSYPDRDSQNQLYEFY